MTGNANWLSTATAAETMGITPRTLYRFINDGHLTAYRFGRVIRIKRTDIDAFIETNRISPGDLDHLDNNLGSIDDDEPDDD